MTATGSGSGLILLWACRVDGLYVMSKQITALSGTVSCTTYPVAFTYGVRFDFYVAIGLRPEIYAIR
jgi:hypothetical protein